MLEYAEEHPKEIRAWYAAQAESKAAQEAYERAYLEHLEERGELDDDELGGDGAEGEHGGVHYIEPIEGDPVLEPIHLMAVHERTRRGGANIYRVTATSPSGGDLSFTAEELDGRWKARIPRKGPAKVRSALRNWVEAGQLGEALDLAVPF